MKLILPDTGESLIVCGRLVRREKVVTTPVFALFDPLPRLPIKYHRFALVTAAAEGFLNAVPAACLGDYLN